MRLITDITLELAGEERLYMVSAKQGDKKTRYVRVLLTNNGKEFIVPDGLRVIANIKKPDRKFCYNECVLEDNRIIIELTNQALAAAGTGHCDVEIRDEQNELVLTTQAFTIEIEESMRDENAIESSNEMTALEKKVQKYIDDILLAKEDVRSVEEAVKIAEAARQRAEADRTATEGERAENERRRIAAETTRQQQLDLMQQATAASNTAAQEAQKQATAAQEATEKAEKLYKTETELQKMYEQMIAIKGTVGSCIDGGMPESVDAICCDGGTPFTIEDCEADAGSV